MSPIKIEMNRIDDQIKFYEDQIKGLKRQQKKLFLEYRRETLNKGQL